MGQKLHTCSTSKQMTFIACSISLALAGLSLGYLQNVKSEQGSVHVRVGGGGGGAGEGESGPALPRRKS